MRCWSSDGAVGAPACAPRPRTARGAHARRALACTGSLLLVAACVKTTSVTYLPSPEQPRLDLAGGARTLERFLGLECGRLVEAGHGSGETVVRVSLDSAGLAIAAELARSTGDARADGIVGAVAAQLQFAAPGVAAGAASVRARYRCADDGGITAELTPG